MQRKVFISFRFKDGYPYKEELCKRIATSGSIMDCSEDKDRSMMSQDIIKNYLYRKLSQTSATIIIVTPKAIEYNINSRGEVDDWMYDEARYSLEDRTNNRTNGLIALYTKEAGKQLLEYRDNIIYVKDARNLFRKNMMNIKNEYKHDEREGIYDSNYDSYCSLISFDSFLENPEYYINIAETKRDKINEYNIRARLGDF